MLVLNLVGVGSSVGSSVGVGSGFGVKAQKVEHEMKLFWLSLILLVKIKRCDEEVEAGEKEEEDWLNCEYIIIRNTVEDT